jgi:hypothetical protein
MPHRRELAYLISFLVPSASVNVESTFLELRSSQYIDLKNISNLVYKDKAITRVRLIANFGNPKIYDLEVYSSSRVLLTHNNEEGEYTFDSNLTDLEKIYDRLYIALMLHENVLAEYAFCQSDGRAFSSETWLRGLSHVYDKAAHDFYKMARELIVVKLKEFLRTKYTVEISNHNMSIRLISLGCGEGDDLLQAIQQLSDEMNIIEALGFDISEMNLLIARNKCGSKAILLKSSLFDLAIIMRQRQEETIMNIGIAVGSLTRNVLNGTQESLQVLQQIFRCLNVIAITGYTAPLLTLAMANAIGFTGIVENYKNNDPAFPHEVKELYILSHPDEKELSDLLLYKFDEKRAWLDLVMSANPVFHLASFAKMHPAKVAVIRYIDISFANLPKTEHNALYIELRKYSAVKEIYYNGSVDIDDDNFNFIRAVTRPHSVHEVPFYIGDVEHTLEKFQKKPDITITPVVPKVTKDKNFCFFKVHPKKIPYITELQSLVGNTNIRLVTNNIYTKAYFAMSWLKKLSPTALDEISAGAKPVADAWIGREGCGVDRKFLSCI